MGPLVAGRIGVVASYLYASASTANDQQAIQLLHSLCLGQEIPQRTRQKHISELSQSLCRTAWKLMAFMLDPEFLTGTGIFAVCLIKGHIIAYCTGQKLHVLSTQQWLVHVLQSIQFLNAILCLAIAHTVWCFLLLLPEIIDQLARCIMMRKNCIPSACELPALH